jgi:hypothetical protein
MLGAVMNVRQNIWSDDIERDMIRVFPFTDIQYAGAESAKSNSVLASCLVPAIASVDVQRNSGKNPMWQEPPRDSVGAAAKDWSPAEGGKTPWMLHRTGMVDYLFGIDESTSMRSLPTSYDDENPMGMFEPDAPSRLDVLTGADVDRQVSLLGGTRSIRIMNFSDDDEALDEITGNPGKMTVGYVVGPREVKLYYTDAAVAEIARRSRSVIQALGPYRPQLMPYGLGSIEYRNQKPDEAGPETIDVDSRGQYVAHGPGLSWSVGAVQHRSRTLPADGQLYIAGDQIPYSHMRRSFKYGHAMTQIGMELLECCAAIGIDLDSSLNHIRPAYSENGSGIQECALQTLYASMFGTQSGFTAGQGDYEVAEDMVASKIKDYLMSFFNSGHVHVDPGVFAYLQGADFDEQGGFLSQAKTFNVRGTDVDAQTAYAEFVRAYFTWAAMCAALEQYMSVPLLQCHWMYTNKMKPEYVLDQMQRNIRADVYYDGDSSLPFTLVPDRLNPGEVLHRAPMYFDTSKVGPNILLGFRDPLPYGPVEEIRYMGDRPLTMIEDKRDYTFSPVIEADGSVHTTTRNGRNVNYVNWPRPTYYVPGATRAGLIYGLMADNQKVGGSYYYVPGPGIFEHPSSGDAVYRSMRGGQISETMAQGLLAGQLDDAVHEEYFAKKAIPPAENPQLSEAVMSAEAVQRAAESIQEEGSSANLAEAFGYESRRETED